MMFKARFYRIKKNMKAIPQSLFFAFFFNSLRVPIAVGILYTFWESFGGLLIPRRQ